MESSNIVNRYCIITAVTALHNRYKVQTCHIRWWKKQQQKKQNKTKKQTNKKQKKKTLFYNVCVFKIPRLTVLLTLASLLVHW